MDTVAFEEQTTDVIVVEELSKDTSLKMRWMLYEAETIFLGSNELMLHMLSFLQPKDLVKCSRVSKEWKQICEDHTLWRAFIKRIKYPVNTDGPIVPAWAQSWMAVWKWFYLAQSKVFQEGEEKNVLGTFIWKSNGSRYEGEWKENKENGRGYKYWPDGATFEGEWKEGKFNGYGKHTWASGSSYEGSWVNHKRNGWGKNTWVQKDCYEGEWIDDQKDGKGTYIWSDGRRYEGHWGNDKRSGYGVFIWPKLGCRYEGEWKDDNRHGFGKFKWKDSDIYEGQWVHGKRFGKGKLTTSSGVFLQEWREIDEFDASNKGNVLSPANMSAADCIALSMATIPSTVASATRAGSKRRADSQSVGLLDQAFLEAELENIKRMRTSKYITP